METSRPEMDGSEKRETSRVCTVGVPSGTGLENTDLTTSLYLESKKLPRLQVQVSPLT